MTICLADLQNPLDKFSNLIELLSYRAKNQPQQRAYIFLKDGETEENSLTYGELDLQARAIATHLQSLVSPGDVYDGLRLRALLLYPPGLEFISAFFGCLYAGLVAVPAYPPRANMNLLRLQAIAKGAQAKVVLTTKSLLTVENPELATMRWLNPHSALQNVLSIFSIKIPNNVQIIKY
ncbi:MAG: AMP-binding protein [Nostoc sp.]